MHQKQRIARSQEMVCRVGFKQNVGHLGTEITAVAGEEPANCSAVAGLCLKWDFTDKVWNATFVSGRFKGTSRRVAAQDITAAQWYKIRSRDPAVKGVDGYFQHATLLSKKSASRFLITQWCGAITREEAGAFEREWGLTSPTLETPDKKKRKRHQNQEAQGAVAEELTAVAEGLCMESQ